MNHFGIWIPEYRQWMLDLNGCVISYGSLALARAHVLTLRERAWSDEITIRRIGLDGYPKDED